MSSFPRTHGYNNDSSAETRDDPTSQGSSPYKIVYGRPPTIIKQVPTNLPQIRGDEISQQMEQLGKVINQETKFVQHKLESRLPGEISRTSDMQMTPQLWQKVKRN